MSWFPFRVQRNKKPGLRRQDRVSQTNKPKSCIRSMNNKNKIASLALLGLALASSAMAQTEPETGIAGLDAAIVVMVASVAAIGLLAGGGAAIRGGVVIFNKVVKYFSKSV